MMANNNSLDEYLVYLKENARELRKLGKEWGMTEEEIDSCVNEALLLSEEKEELKNSPKNLARKIWSYFLVLLKFHIVVGLIFLGTFVAFYVAASYHEPTQRLIINVITPYSYQLMRFARLAAIPLHSMFSISKYHHDECLVKNPFFVEPVPDCNICRSFKKIKAINASEFTDLKFTSYSVTMKPVQIKNSITRNITYADLRVLYNGLQDNLFYQPHVFTSNSQHIQSLEDLFTDNKSQFIESTGDLHVHWQSQTVKASAGLRTLFPRPQYLPEESEVVLSKNIFIDGPNATTYKLPSVLNTPLNLYTQGSGHRRLLARPAPQCKDVCNSMLVFMEPGDSFLFNKDLWHVYVATAMNETSIGYSIGIQT